MPEVVQITIFWAWDIHRVIDKGQRLGVWEVLQALPLPPVCSGGRPDKSPGNKNYTGHRRVRVHRGNMRFRVCKAILDFYMSLLNRTYWKTTKIIRI